MMKIEATFDDGATVSVTLAAVETTDMLDAAMAPLEAEMIKRGMLTNHPVAQAYAVAAQADIRMDYRV